MIFFLIFGFELFFKLIDWRRGFLKSVYGNNLFNIIIIEFMINYLGDYILEKDEYLNILRIV